MKTGKSLVELAAEIQRRADSKRDLIANSSNMALIPAAGELDYRLMVGTEQTEGLTELGHDQLGDYCDIPAKYYDRCRANNPALLAENVNHWLRDKHEPRLVRILDGKARAFLSDIYRPMENEDLANAILPILLGDGKFELMSCEITERKLYLKVVDSSVTRALAKTGHHFGDGQHHIERIVAPAITVSNSEVGEGALSIMAGIYDRFCTNLSTFGERSMRKYHTGSRHELLGEDIVALLSEDTRRKTDAALWGQVRDIVKGAFDPARFNALVDRIEETRAVSLPKEADVVKVVSLASQRLGIKEGEQRGVLQYLIEGGELNRFGLYNAVTRYSQDVDSYDRATELERVGAQVIELPRNDWDRLVTQSLN